MFWNRKRNTDQSTPEAINAVKARKAEIVRRCAAYAVSELAEPMPFTIPGHLVDDLDFIGDLVPGAQSVLWTGYVTTAVHGAFSAIDSHDGPSNTVAGCATRGHGPVEMIQVELTGTTETGPVTETVEIVRDGDYDDIRARTRLALAAEFHGDEPATFDEIMDRATQLAQTFGADEHAPLAVRARTRVLV